MVFVVDPLFVHEFKLGSFGIGIVKSGELLHRHLVEILKILLGLPVVLAGMHRGVVLFELPQSGEHDKPLFLAAVVLAEEMAGLEMAFQTLVVLIVGELVFFGTHVTGVVGLTQVHLELVLVEEVPVAELAIRVQEHQVAVIVEISIVQVHLQLPLRKQSLLRNY